MKLINEKVMANGRRRVTLELDHSEKVLGLANDAYYRIGYPIEDVVAAHILTDSVRVTWDSCTQKWID